MNIFYFSITLVKFVLLCLKKAVISLATCPLLFIQQEDRLSSGLSGGFATPAYDVDVLASLQLEHENGLSVSVLILRLSCLPSCYCHIFYNALYHIYFVRSVILKSCVLSVSSENTL